MFTFRLGRIGVASTGHLLHRPVPVPVRGAGCNGSAARASHDDDRARRARRRPGWRAAEARQTPDRRTLRGREADVSDTAHPRGPRSRRGRRTGLRRATDRAPAVVEPAPDLALLARPDGDRRRGRLVRDQPPRVRRPSVPKDQVGTSMFVHRHRRRRSSGSSSSPPSATISDYTVSKWGRRKPFIVFGSLFDVAFRMGIATGQLPARPRPPS